MALLGGGDSSDSGLLVGIAMFCTVMSLISTLLISALLPSLALGYSFDEVQAAREEVIAFTGDTITNDTPWELDSVYTPYQVGSAYNVDASGFLYGDSINYDQIGKHADIKLNVDQKSNQTLASGKMDVTISETVLKKFYDPNQIGPLAWANISFATNANRLLDWIGLDDRISISTEETTEKTYPTWSYTGYRYLFKPMLPFEYIEGEPQKKSATDGTLSIIWYDVDGMEGISGGLVVYNANKVIIANYSASDIIANYNTASGLATRYNFTFEGTPIYLNIRFDADVLNNSIPLEQAWHEGKWSLAITSPSAGNFLDLKNSAAFTTSLGSMVDTFIDIYTFDVPQVDNSYYELVLWLLVVFPAELALMLFLKSVFGMAGVGAGILGNLIAMVV